MITEGMQVHHSDYGVGTVITESNGNATVSFNKHGSIRVSTASLRQSINS